MNSKMPKRLMFVIGFLAHIESQSRLPIETKPISNDFDGVTAIGRWPVFVGFGGIIYLVTQWISRVISQNFQIIPKKQ